MKLSRTALRLLLFASIVYNSMGKDVFVDCVSAGSGSCGSIENPCPNLATGLSVSGLGDTIVVAPCQYFGPKNSNLCLKPLSCPKNFTVKGAGRGVRIQGGGFQNVHAFIILNKTVAHFSNIDFHGFYLNGGKSSEEVGSGGAALLVSSSTVVLESVSFTNNSASQV